MVLVKNVTNKNNYKLREVKTCMNINGYTSPHKKIEILSL